MSNSREYTQEEVQDKFLAHVRSLIKYWNSVEGQTTSEKLDGLAFSIMVAIDGGAGGLPSFVLAPFPHESDRQYHIDNGENYYPEDPIVKCNIAGYLHDELNI